MSFVAIAAASPDARPCTPTVHAAEGPQPDGVSRFTFLGASPDGRRAALLLSRPGPRPFANVVVYEAGRDTALAEHLAFAETEATARAEAEERAKPSLAAWKIEPRSAPAPIAWCKDGDTVRLEGATWSWSTVRSECPDPERHTLDWRLCDGAQPDRCVAPMSLDTCWAQPVGLVGVYRASDVLWVVAERVFSEDRRARMAGGIAP